MKTSYGLYLQREILENFDFFSNLRFCVMKYFFKLKTHSVRDEMFVKRQKIAEKMSNKAKKRLRKH